MAPKSKKFKFGAKIEKNSNHKTPKDPTIPVKQDEIIKEKIVQEIPKKEEITKNLQPKIIKKIKSSIPKSGFTKFWVFGSRWRTILPGQKGERPFIKDRKGGMG